MNNDNDSTTGRSAGRSTSTGSNTTTSHQLLLYLTDFNYFFFAKIATLFTIAWETIAYAWVTTLIQPDKYHNPYFQNDYIYQSTSTNTNTRNTNNNHYQLNPITNVFDNWSHGHGHTPAGQKNVIKKQKMFLRDSVNNDDSSWGQFVDVDLTNYYHHHHHVHLTSRRIHRSK